MNKRILFVAVAIAGGLAPLSFAQAGSRPDSHTDTSGAPIVLTLQSTVARTVANHPMIGEAADRLAARKSAVEGAMSHYYPQVVGSGSYNRVEPNQSVDFPGIGSVSLSQENVWDFHLGVSEVLLDSGRRAASVRLARSGVDSAQLSLEQVTQSLAYRAVDGFFAALFLQEQVHSLDEQVAGLTEHLDLARKRVEVGSATGYDVLSTQARVSALESRRTEARNQFEKMLIELRSLTGLAPDAAVELRGSFADPQAGGESARGASAYLEHALADRPEMNQARAAERSTRLELDLARLRGLPTLSAQAEAGYKNGLLPNTDSLTFNWSAGLELSVPLFSGFAASSRTDEAEDELNAARKHTEAVARTITREVLQAYQDVQAARAVAESSVVQVRQADAALKAARVQYNIGAITNVGFLDAQRDLEQAKLASLKSTYEEVVAVYALGQAAGEPVTGTDREPKEGTMRPGPGNAPGRSLAR